MDHARARFNMVENSIRTNKVTDPNVVEAMQSVPREAYVPQARQGIAYFDEDIPLGAGRFLMDAMVLARLLQEARVEKSDVALIIGTGLGYSAAVVAALADTVVAIESDAAMVAAASDTLTAHGVDNAIVIEAPLTGGYAKQAPFDLVLFDGAVTQVPPVIFDQLGEGGRLVAVVKKPGHVAQAFLYEKQDGVIGEVVLFDAAVPLLPGFGPVEDFVF